MERQTNTYGDKEKESWEKKKEVTRNRNKEKKRYGTKRELEIEETGAKKQN